MGRTDNKIFRGCLCFKAYGLKGLITIDRQTDFTALKWTNNNKNKAMWIFLAKLKILQVYDFMKLGGAESHIITLSKELIDQGHTVHIASSDGPAVSRIYDLRIPFHEVDVYNPKNYFTNAEIL